jgi:hypothetical protein
MTTIPKKQYAITANDLYNGEVVFWENPDEWGYLLADAYIFDQKHDAEDQLERVRPDQVVGAYLIVVDIDAEDQITPTHLREAIRASGPSNYFHGKQSDRKTISLVDRISNQKGA